VNLDRLVAVMSFVPGELEIIEPPDVPTVLPTGGAPAPVTPSTSFGPTGTGTGFDTAAPPTDTEEAPPSDIPVATGRPTGPQMPGYVWALLPVGLLALGAVRSVVLEPGAGARPDGVIAAIRRRNLERRGIALREVRQNPLTGALRGARRGLSRSGRAVVGAATKITRRVSRR
jgi:hypothetical protein